MMRSVFSLPRSIWLLSLMSLFNDAASDMIYPLMPLYLSSVLMAGPSALGLIEGVAEAISSLIKLFAGVLSDRTQRMRRWVIGGYTIAGFARPLIALTTSWIGVFACRFADRIGKGLRSAPRDALISLNVSANQRGLAFGFHRAMDNFGAVIGPLIAAALLSYGFSLRQIFLFAVIPAVVVLALSLKVSDPPPSSSSLNIQFRWTLAGQSPAFRRYLVALALFTLGDASNMFLLLRAHTLGVKPEHVMLMWALYSAVAALFSTPLSALSDRLGRIRLLSGAWIAYAGVYVVWGLLPSATWALWAIFASYGLVVAALGGPQKALVADLAQSDHIGAAYGWYNLVSGFILLPASLIFGLLWQNVTPLAAFGFSGSCALLAALLLMFWVKPPTEQSGMSAV